MRTPLSIALRHLFIACPLSSIFLAADALKYGLGWHSVLTVSLVLGAAAYSCAVDAYEAGRGAKPPDLPAPPDWMVEEVQRRTGRGPDECRRILASPTLAEYWALTGDGPDGHERHDPGEFAPAFAPALLRATLEARREGGEGGDYGYCFVFWERKRQILWKRYGVWWRDPADLNPENAYD